MTDLTPAMTVRQIAAYLNVNEKTVYRLAQRRELPGFKVAGAWRFRPEDIEALGREAEAVQACGAGRGMKAMAREGPGGFEQ